MAGRAIATAKDIKALIEQSGAAVSGGVGLVNQTGQVLSEIEGQVHEVADLIGLIVTSADEQSAALTQVNAAVSRMDQVTQKNAAMVQQTNAACRGLNTEAAGLETIVAQFQTGEDKPRRKSSFAA